MALFALVVSANAADEKAKADKETSAPKARTLQFSDAMRSLIEMSDADQGGAAELQKIYDMLRKLDTNKNGKIDPSALHAEAETILKERVNDIFDRLDSNKDGKISKDEARGLIKQDFDKIDTNKDGFIDRDELLKAAQARHERKAPAAKEPRTNKEK